MFEMDDLIADLDLSGAAVNQIDDLRGYLRREAKRVCRARRCRLQPIPSLRGDRFRYGIGIWRQSAERGVCLRNIVDPRAIRLIFPALVKRLRA